MVRLLPFALIFVIAATILIISPFQMLHLLSRLWLLIVPPTTDNPRVPGWVYYYRWASNQYPAPSEMQLLEDIVRITGAIMLTPLALILIIMVIDKL